MIQGFLNFSKIFFSPVYVSIPCSMTFIMVDENWVWSVDFSSNWTKKMQIVNENSLISMWKVLSDRLFYSSIVLGMAVNSWSTRPSSFLDWNSLNCWRIFAQTNQDFYEMFSKVRPFLEYASVTWICYSNVSTWQLSKMTKKLF